MCIRDSCCSTRASCRWVELIWLPATVEDSRSGCLLYTSSSPRDRQKDSMQSFALIIRRPPRSTQSRSSAASDVYKRQLLLHQGQLPLGGVDLVAGHRRRQQIG